MDIDALKIPANKIKQFQRVGINTLEDLLMDFPRKYQYFGKVMSFSELPGHVGENISFCGTVANIYTSFKNVYRVSAMITDRHGNRVNAVWFNQKFISNYVYTGMFILVHGKLTYNEQYDSYSIFPDYYCTDINHFNDVIPVYRKIPGMANDYIRSCVKNVLETVDYVNLFDQDSHIDDNYAKAIGVCSFKDVIRMAHFPESQDDCERVHKWQVASLLTAFAIEMVERKLRSQSESSCVLDRQKAVIAQSHLKQKLPYRLTADQEKAVANMTEIMCSGKRLSALLQGDVGCGKTIVAFLMAVATVECGYQVAIMAPTYVLAEQHYLDLCKILDGTDIQVAFLHSNLKAAEKRKIYPKIENGEISIVVGTHAVLGDNVIFKNLALTVVDEEHRFGVKQRELMMDKAAAGTHHINMSATPIPRSLALATIGDNISIENIRTMPNGRLPVQTIVYSNAQKTYEAMLRQIRAGHQCYVVCPLIQDSDSERMSDVVSVESVLEEMQKFYGNCPDVKIAAITGKMKQAEIQERIDAFKKGDVNILLSTTIVEVGVNVPNATVMVIRNAERFGLAQLHQLRGRVGRSSYQSYCVLLSRDKSNPRLQAMAKTTDGFEIAEEDMKLRGTGNLIGVEQSGYDKCVTAMLQNQTLYQKIVTEVQKMVSANRRYSAYRKFAESQFAN